MGFLEWDDARQAFYTRVTANWPVTPVVEVFRAGGPLPDMETRTTPFLVLKVQPIRAQQLGMSGASLSKKYTGRFEACLFVPSGTGDAIVNQVLATLDNMFTARSFSGIVCRESHMPEACEAVGWRSQDFYSHFYFVKF